MTTPHELMEIAHAIAQEAATLVREGRQQAAVAGTKSSIVDIVTQMDIAAEDLIRTRLAELRPDDAVHGEEHADVSGTSGVTWIVDPIDGTVNYLYGLPHYAVSIAAVTGEPQPHTWQLEAGVIVDGSGATWQACRDGGSWCNGERLERDSGPSLESTLVATGFQYQAARRARQGQIVAQLLPHVRDIRRLGSAAVDLCHVAAGIVDVYYEHGLNPWDFAAGMLIAQEAGLKVAGLHGEAADQRLLIAATEDRWDALHEALVEAGADDTWTSS
ncbi:inositol monophosphatase [Demequina sp. B12]|uniref:inositol monophosphatase family protein n=1 Tax=Demequina sp. B12 TaxID=2992757 RepID=UPI00237A0EEF|nr:inositol monophosphatase family protein [Demequina sp. B12]MDE0572988.1 inositol monophosphatase [Demequina sp. B12]